MFFLTKIEHSLRIPPVLLKLPLEDAIKIELQRLFLDKVIQKSGLCISIYDLDPPKGGLVYPGDGAPTYDVKFRLVMLRPYKGEIIVAKLKESNKDGIRLSLGFFDDIFIPAYLMPTPSRFVTEQDNPNYNTWIWDYAEGDDRFYIDGSSEIRFRVHDVKYPTLPIQQPKDSKPFAPMEIIGSIAMDGLGPISWWNGAGEEQEEEAEEEEEDEKMEPES